jgi:hypothetical protein
MSEYDIWEYDDMAENDTKLIYMDEETLIHKSYLDHIRFFRICLNQIIQAKLSNYIMRGHLVEMQGIPQPILILPIPPTGISGIHLHINNYNCLYIF